MPVKTDRGQLPEPGLSLCLKTLDCSIHHMSRDELFGLYSQPCYITEYEYGYFLKVPDDYEFESAYLLKKFCADELGYGPDLRNVIAAAWGMGCILIWLHADGQTLKHLKTYDW